MDNQEIITILKEEKKHLEVSFGVKQIALIGSYAKQEQTPQSDIDFFVEFQKPSYGLLADLKAFLEQKFNANIDIVRSGPHLSERFLNHIKKEMIYVR
ncbi:nucleotidyltransferase domain-containing protein [Flavobacterium sp.]|uniref:nucleotidyltransferase family protein n=1 Tax=Flavobacterium sp. TaxID=239 RepID=UPI0025C414D4|nr:nucleotidyltransferase domain-containing protein [Flavobacterium sp.]MBA4154839.1 toxin-antitoxin system toxin subunit [Flavobacterium sp.]